MHTSILINILNEYTHFLLSDIVSNFQLSSSALDKSHKCFRSSLGYILHMELVGQVNAHILDLIYVAQLLSGKNLGS